MATSAAASTSTPTVVTSTTTIATLYRPAVRPSTRPAHLFLGPAPALSGQLSAHGIQLGLQLHAPPLADGVGLLCGPPDGHLTRHLHVSRRTPSCHAAADGGVVQGQLTHGGRTAVHSAGVLTQPLPASRTAPCGRVVDLMRANRFAPCGCKSHHCNYNAASLHHRIAPGCPRLNPIRPPRTPVCWGFERQDPSPCA